MEDILARFADEAPSNPHRLVQLAAVRFYLQSVIVSCENAWYRDKPVPTNMMALYDEIENARGTRAHAAFVTFNYDRIIEDALLNRGWGIRDIRDYALPSRTALFKLHGSVDWARPVAEYDRSVFGGGKWEVARAVCEKSATFGAPGEIFHWNDMPNSVAKEAVTLPALAIPVKSKTSFECPDAHVSALVQRLPLVTAVLTIGWRGAETQFLQLLRDKVRPDVEALCVSDSNDNADATAAQLRTALPAATVRTFGAGFSEFIRHRAILPLLEVAYPA